MPISPLWVSIARGDLAARPVHDHRFGRCDLPALLVVDRAAFQRRPGPRSSCWWEFHFSGTYVCCCPLCHAGPRHKADRRVVRHRDHEALRIALHSWRAGNAAAFDDVDLRTRCHWW